ALPGAELGHDGVPPRPPRVAPAVHPERPHPGLVGHDRGLPRVAARFERSHPDQLRLAVRPGPHDRRADGLMALPPDRRPNRDVLSHDGLARIPPAGDNRADLVDADPTTHVLHQTGPAPREKV